jgi:hypothetical protein
MKRSCQWSGTLGTTFEPERFKTNSKKHFKIERSTLIIMVVLQIHIFFINFRYFRLFLLGKWFSSQISQIKFLKLENRKLKISL